MAPDTTLLPIRVLDCLKICYKLKERNEEISTSTMCDKLKHIEPSGQLSDATVTQLFKLLSKYEYAHYEPYHGVELTESGMVLATELIRKHRLLETFLVEVMNFPMNEVDAEAEKLEHAISEKFVNRMDEMLKFPTEDPHGDPIPNKFGQVIQQFNQPLNSVEPGRIVTVQRIIDDEPALVEYLISIGVKPGAVLQIIALSPFDNIYTVKVNHQEHHIGPRTSSMILVQSADTPSKDG